MSSAHDENRTFAPFLDEVDMVMCCAASKPLAEVNERAAAVGLRFPLVCDPAASLAEHCSATDYAGTSARFGSYADNVLGMNWELLSGRIVRIGERVIKSATGYDLLRFLLHTDGRYGHARDYVIRLRPLRSATLRVVFQDSQAKLGELRDQVLSSSWVHWLDCVDLYVADNGRCALALEVNCGVEEQTVFAEYFDRLGADAEIVPSGLTPLTRVTLPTMSVKTTLTTAPALARRLVDEYGGSARVLCVNGVVHYFRDPQTRFAITDALMASCVEDGGHIMAAESQFRPAHGEATWAESLETTWRGL